MTLPHHQLDQGGASTDDTVFEGGFTPQERSFLARQFSRCRFELLARSVLDDRIALVRWQPLTRGNTGGPRPLFAAPSHATYVLGLSTGPGGASVKPQEHDDRAGPVLNRVDNTAALEAGYPGHFPSVQLQTPGWLRLRRAWYRAIPVLIVVLAAVWLALVLWQTRGS